MPVERPVSDVQQFMELAVQSGLLSECDSRLLLDRFYNRFAGESPLGTTITSLMTFLVASQTLTPWQCDKLRHGRFKGFFLDNFKLLDWIRAGDEESYFLGQDMTSGRLFELAVTPIHGVPPNESIYRIVKEVSPRDTGPRFTSRRRSAGRRS